MPPGSGQRRRVPVEILREAVCDAPVAVTVRGTSMLPVLADGDRIGVRRRLPLPGDVVVFRPADDAALVVHRLLGVYRRRGEWRLVALGDALARPDSPVPVARLVGVGALPVPFGVRLRCAAAFVRWVVARLP